MKSPTIFKDNYRNKSGGLTLIEIIVVVAVIGAVVAIGMIIDSSAFRRKTLSSEESTLISILSKARSRAMNNIESSEHGVYIEADKYILFRNSYDPDDENNEEIERNENIQITGLEEVSFLQLSGEPSDTGEIILDDGVQTKIITIREGGLIDW